MQPTTPIGSRSTSELPISSLNENSPSIRSATPLATAIGNEAWTLSENEIGDPISAVIVAAISSRRAPSSAEIRRMTATRSSTDVCDHETNALFAARTAASTSAAVPAGTAAITVSVAGLTTSMVSPPPAVC
jgi:hypothetical protein